MKKTKKINKIMLVLTLVLAFALAFVIVSSATDLLYTSDQSAFEDMTEEGETYGDGYVTLGGNGYGYLINYGNISNANFVINVIEVFHGSYSGYVYWLSSYEAFQIRYNGYTVEQIYYEWIDQELYNLTYLTYECVEYFLNYQPPISQDQFNRLEQEYSTLEQTYKQLVISNNTLQSDYNTLQGEFNTLQNDYTRLGALLDDTVNQYNTLQSDYNTLQGEFNTLQNEYNTLESTIPVVRQEGYNQGMEDADAVERGVMSIVGAPMYILTSIFDVEIFGINLLNLITTIMTIIIVAWVIKKLAN